VATKATDEVPAKGPEVDDAIVKKAVNLSAMAAASSSVAYAAMMVLALPFSINHIINGHAGIPSEDSQGVYSVCFFLKQVGSVLFAAMLGELGNQIGRKKIINAALFAYFLTAVLSFVGTSVEMVLIHMIAQFILGMFSPFFPNGMAYMIDVSPVAQLGKNVGKFSAWSLAGLLFGFMIAGVSVNVRVVEVPSAANMKNAILVQYGFAALATLIPFFVLVAMLPDLSPRMEHRHPYRCKKGIPLHMVKDMLGWSGYMRLTYLQILMGPGAASSAAMTYGVNYAIKRYDLDVATVSNILIADFLLSSICAGLSLRFMRFKVLIPFTYVVSILCAAAFLIPGDNVTWLWVITLVSATAAAQQHALNALFYEQVAETERGSLAGALKTADAVGRVLGAFVGGIMGTMYMESVDIQESMPGFPHIGPLIFMSLALVFYIMAEFFHGNQNKMEQGEEKGAAAM
jgi:hypothetical protein